MNLCNEDNSLLGAQLHPFRSTVHVSVDVIFMAAVIVTLFSHFLGLPTMGVPVVVSDEDWADVGRFWEEVSATYFDVFANN
eukprot:SAG31_NODE_1428_length_8391_cov_4.335866_6_plen_81_part_00